MAEDTFDDMKEFGPELGIGTSNHTDFGDYAPRAFEFSGNAGKTPEKQEQDAVREWMSEVKKEIENGNAVAFVHARVNFDLDKDGNLSLTRNDGYQNILIRGENVDDAKADKIRSLLNYATQSSYDFDRDDKHAMMPMRLDDNTLYVTVSRSENIPQQFVAGSGYSEINPLVTGKDIVELRYSQPKADESNRTPEKRIILVVPHNISENLQSMIEQGIDPNTLRDMSAEIFTSGKGLDLYDSNLVDRYSRPENPVLKKTAEKPHLTQTFIQVTQKGGDRQQIPAEKQIITPHTSDKATIKNPDSESVANNVSEQATANNEKEETDERWSQFGDVDWDSIGNGSNENETLAAEAESNWYVDLAHDWKNRPQTRDYWENRRNFLKEGGMSDKQIGDLIRNHSIKPEINSLLDLDSQEDSNKTPKAPLLPDTNDAWQPAEQGRERRANPQDARFQMVDDEGNQTVYNDKDVEIRMLNDLENLPPTEQRKLVFEFLDKVEEDYREKYIDQLPGQVGRAMRNLETIIRQYDDAPEKSPLDLVTVKWARARIRVHDMSVAVLFLNFKPEDIKGDIREKFKGISAGGRVLDGEDLALLMKNEVNVESLKNVEFGEQIQAGAAMNVLQEAAIYGIDGLRWGDKKLTAEQQRTLQSKILEKLPANCDKIATLRVAQRLSKITFEASVWATEATDPASQVFYFENARRDVLDKRDKSQTVSDDPGPLVTVDMVPGFGTSLLRRATYRQGSETVRLFGADKWKQAVAASYAGKTEEAMNLSLSVNRIGKRAADSSQNMLIDFTKLDYEKLPANTITDYYQKYLPALKNAESYLLKSVWKPDDFNEDKISDMVTAFAYADPDEILYLRGTFLFGVIKSNMDVYNEARGRKGTFQDPNAVRNFFTEVTRGSRPLISKKELDYLRKQLKPIMNAERWAFFDDLVRPVIQTSRG